MDELDEILKTLTARQLDFVSARIFVTSDVEAAEIVGIPKDTVWGWANKSEINRAVQLAKLDTVQVGREKLRRLIPKAVNTLDDEMDNAKRRLDAAKEVLDRAGLVAVKRLDITSKNKRIIVGGLDLNDDV